MNVVPESRLRVKGFSSLVDIDVNFLKNTVLIGEQASGKSLVAKLFHFCTDVFRNVLLQAVVDRSSFEQFIEGLKERFEECFPKYIWNAQSFNIIFSSSCGEFKISHCADWGTIRISCKEIKKLYPKVISESEAYMRTRQGVRWDAPDSFPPVALERFVLDRFEASGLNGLPTVAYVPAGRSFFAAIKENVFTLLSENIGIDFYLKQFGRRLEMAKRPRYHRDELAESGSHKHVYSVMNSVCRGAYSYARKQDWIVDQTGKKIRLSDGSSGQQEVIPLLVVLDRYLEFRYGHKSAIVIEEPEAHLYPTAQKKVVDLIVDEIKNCDDSSCVITTHSPYILCCINNYINKNALSGADVSAYHITDGVSRNIVNDETGLIDAEKFDAVSFDIMNDGVLAGEK